MAQVKLDKVCKIYEGGVMAVREFNLSISDGEFVVFVGPSGCGKSTTLRMLAGLEEISSGTISIDGKVVNEVHPKDRDIAMVFQNYALYPHMTVYKNMALALELRRVPKPEIQRRVMEAAKTLGLEPYLERRPKALSGGQRQRVAVGRAIVREPKAFLFDEPLSNLDAKLRVSMRAELKAMHQRLKTTTVYVTHDQEEAMTLGDRIVVMAAGIIQQAAPPMEVYRRPANMFVAGFVGIPPMNFLPGVLVTQAGGLAFVEQGGATVSLPAAHAAKLREFADKPVVLGVRPQQLSVMHNAAPGTAISIKVEITEPLGDLLDISGQTPAGHRIVARLPAVRGELPSVVPGQTVELLADIESSHIFEPGEFGRNLTL